MTRLREVTCALCCINHILTSLKTQTKEILIFAVAGRQIQRFEPASGQCLLVVFQWLLREQVIKQRSCATSLSAVYSAPAGELLHDDVRP